MKIYLAANYSKQLEMRRVRMDILGLNFDHRVLGSWIFMSEVDPRSGEDLQHSAARWAQHAQRNYNEIHECDILFFFSGPPSSGRHIEFGYARALGKQIVIIGPWESIFHTDPHVFTFTDWDECLSCLREVGVHSDLRILNKVSANE